ncbi:5'-3' exoribonuclease 2 homolog [Nylanderia fulva]|uniref:5'-3' exoribonuclease 2 homolog n=1 Tax=Nylanderia fulva TaxID=613905 RepID=UPI0010FB4840|nr:5'-3' exoribonuclease 2 homolog [Nylanderia fulva]
MHRLQAILLTSVVSIEFEKDTNTICPLKQLMGVFPAGSKKHLSVPWVKLMIDPGFLTDSGDVSLDCVQLIMSDLGDVEDEIFKKRLLDRQ